MLTPFPFFKEDQKRIPVISCRTLASVYSYLRIV